MGFIYYHAESGEIDKDEEKNFTPKAGQSKFLIERCRCVGSEDFVCLKNDNELWRPALTVIVCEQKAHGAAIKGLKNKTKFTIECYGNLII